MGKSFLLHDMPAMAQKIMIISLEFDFIVICTKYYSHFLILKFKGNPENHLNHEKKLKNADINALFCTTLSMLCINY